MAHFKRKKTKRRVHCQMCTPYRWMGNNNGRFKDKDQWLKKSTGLEGYQEPKQ